MRGETSKGKKRERVREREGEGRKRERKELKGAKCIPWRNNNAGCGVRKCGFTCVLTSRGSSSSAPSSLLNPPSGRGRSGRASEVDGILLRLVGYSSSARGAFLGKRIKRTRVYRGARGSSFARMRVAIITPGCPRKGGDCNKESTQTDRPRVLRRRNELSLPPFPAIYAREARVLRVTANENTHQRY
jgi:hypothetical protein